MKAFFSPVVVVFSTGMSHKDVDGNIGMRLNANSSHTLWWLLVNSSAVKFKKIYLSGKILSIFPPEITVVGVWEELNL